MNCSMGRKSSGGKRGLNMRGNARAAGVIRWALGFAEGKLMKKRKRGDNCHPSLTLFIVVDMIHHG